ncbi:MAG: diguanylate cyclase [Gemmatimonadaceae bacterium]|nr:diguanylate cyclase [Gemmatimonadaceae bacterium]
MSSTSADAPETASTETLRALIDRAHASERQSRRDEARALYESVLQRMRQPLPGLSLTAVVRWIARTYLADAMYEEARDTLELSLALAELAGDVAGIGHSINQMAVLQWQLGDLDSARRMYLTAREYAVRSDEASLVAMTSTNLGVIASVRGDTERALRYFESSLREYRMLGMTRDVCIALNNVGLVHTRLKAWAEAEGAFRQALDVAQTLKDVEIATQLEINLAQVALHRGDHDTARRLVDRALLTAQAHRLGDSLGSAYKLAAEIARTQGELDSALASLGRAADVANQRGNMLLLAEVERKRSRVHRQLGRNRDALQSLNISHRLFTRLQARQDAAAIAQETRALEGDFLELARRWGESTESKDRYTQGHCERVADLSCRIAAAAGLDEKELLWFRIGALLHDVGKLIVPSEVLNKPGRLTKEEWELMKRHPIAGVELLSQVEFPWDILPIVRSHHECWDGTGYPDGLVGEETPLVARIVCLADVYDALTTERSYKRALSHNDALDVMKRDAGRQFDPALFALFERLVRDPSSAASAESPTGDAGRERRGRPALDELTGLPTRRTFVDAARVQLAAATEGAPLALAVIDVDHFKGVNDSFGHLTGDNVLEVVAQVLGEVVRARDVAGRYAGDEFVILLPDTDALEAQRVGERLREAVAARRIPVRGAEERWVSVSLSIGIAVAPRHGAAFEELFASADHALYEAKRRGRNAVAVASHEGDQGKPRLNIQHFVGRQQETARLRSHIEGCVRGAPALVAVIGEAGVGKTTLVQRLSSEIRRRTGTILTARALEPDVRPPFGVWVDLVTQLHQLHFVPERAWPRLARLVPALAGGGAHPDDDEGVGSSKYALLDELVAYIRAAATTRPLMLVLDDVQWADHASWDALEALASAIDHDRLLVCLTVRREDAQQFEASRRRLSRHAMYHEMRLERLTASEVGEWLADVLQQAEREGELAGFLYRYTEGNPLFVVQVLQTLVDEGVLWYDGKRWEWSTVHALQLPPAVDDLIARRLARLAPSTTQVMTTAAVIGRAFEFDLLRRVTELDETALIDAIDEAIEVGVLDGARDREPDRFQFAHTLLADALIRQANPRRVRRLHARAAEVLAAERPNAITEIAVHFDAAGDDGHAFDYAMRSGNAAAEIYALEDAIASYQIAVRRAPAASERLEARLRLIDVARIAGKLETATAECDAARAAVDPDDRLGYVRVSRRALQLQLLQARNIAGVVADGQALLAVAREAGAHEDAVLILASIADAYTRLSRRTDAEREARAATAEAERLGDDGLIADARLRLGAALLESAPHESLQEFESARRRFAARNDRYGVIRCLVNSGIAHARRGMGGAAQLSYEEAQRAAGEANIPDLGGLAALNLGVLFQKTGNFDRAHAAYAHAERMFAKVHNEARRLAAMYNSANLSLEQGDAVAAHEMYERVHAIAIELDILDIEVGALAGSGLAALALGYVDQALLARRRATERSAALGEMWFQGRELLEALDVRYLVATDRHEKAARAFDRARALAATIDEGAALWLVAECAPALTRLGGARYDALIAEAHQRATEFGLRPLASRLAAFTR